MLLKFKKYQAFAQISETNTELVNTVIRAVSKKSAKEWFTRSTVRFEKITLVK